MKINWKSRRTIGTLTLVALWGLCLALGGYNTWPRFILLVFVLPLLLPTLILLLMPGKKSLIGATCLLLAFCVWGHYDAAKAHGGPACLACGIPDFVLISTIFGFCASAGIMFYRNKLRN